MNSEAVQRERESMKGKCELSGILSCGPSSKQDFAHGAALQAGADRAACSVS